MHKIEYSPEAIRDMLNIKNNVSLHCDDNIANDLIDKITDSIKNLGQYPFLGADLGKMLEIPTEYRYFYIEKNYIFYYIEKETVKIVRVINERQDFLRILFNTD